MRAPVGTHGTTTTNMRPVPMRSAWFHLANLKRLKWVALAPAVAMAVCVIWSIRSMQTGGLLREVTVKIPVLVETGARSATDRIPNVTYHNLFEVDVEHFVLDWSAVSADTVSQSQTILTDRVQNISQTDSDTRMRAWRRIFSKQCTRDMFHQLRTATNEYLHSGCTYSRDYQQIERRLPSSHRHVPFLLEDGDTRESHVLVTAKSRAIPNLPQVPVQRLAFPHHTHITVLPLDTRRQLSRHFRHATSDPYTYDQKKPVAFWRGTTTGDCWIERAPALQQGLVSFTDGVDDDPYCARWNLVTRWSFHGQDTNGNGTVPSPTSEVDVGLSSLCQGAPDTVYGRYTQGLIPQHELLAYRYLISVEGNDVATNLLWILASNSVVFMPPPTRETYAMERFLVPWYHYVPIRYDTTDLLQQIRYCNEHEPTCRAIARHGQRWVAGLTNRDKLYTLGAKVLQRHMDVLTEMGVVPSH